MSDPRHLPGRGGPSRQELQGHWDLKGTLAESRGASSDLSSHSQLGHPTIQAGVPALGDSETGEPEGRPSPGEGTVSQASSGISRQRAVRSGV